MIDLHRLTEECDLGFAFLVSRDGTDTARPLSSDEIARLDDLMSLSMYRFLGRDAVIRSVLL